MTMEHKAFLFNTEQFNKELRPIILAASKNYDLNLLRSYIMENIGKVRSIYSGELLENNWENELELGNIQELDDFSMTCFYNPEDDLGLSYSWDILIEVLKTLSTGFDAEYYILGRPLETDTFRLDPGGMGMGFVQMNDTPLILQDLIDLRGALIEDGTIPAEALYECTLSELIAAYDELIALYKEAVEHKSGLLITF